MGGLGRQRSRLDHFTANMALCMLLACALAAGFLPRAAIAQDRLEARRLAVLDSLVIERGAALAMTAQWAFLNGDQIRRLKQSEKERLATLRLQAKTETALVAEQRGRQDDQRRLAQALQRLEEADVELGRIRATVKAFVTANLEQNQAYRTEIGIYRDALSGGISAAGPQLLTAYEQYARGEREAAYPVIEALTRAEITAADQASERARLAIEQATARRNAARLRAFALVTMIAFEHGENGVTAEKVIEIWRGIITLDPSDPRDHVILASLYTLNADDRLAKTHERLARRTTMAAGGDAYSSELSVLADIVGATKSDDPISGMIGFVEQLLTQAENTPPQAALRQMLPLARGCYQAFHADEGVSNLASAQIVPWLLQQDGRDRPVFGQTPFRAWPQACRDLQAWRARASNALDPEIAETVETWVETLNLAAATFVGGPESDLMLGQAQTRCRARVISVARAAVCLSVASTIWSARYLDAAHDAATREGEATPILRNAVSNLGRQKPRSILDPLAAGRLRVDLDQIEDLIAFRADRVEPTDRPDVVREFEQAARNAFDLGDPQRAYRLVLRAQALQAASPVARWPLPGLSVLRLAAQAAEYRSAAAPQQGPQAFGTASGIILSALGAHSGSLNVCYALLDLLNAHLDWRYQNLEGDGAMDVFERGAAHVAACDALAIYVDGPDAGTAAAAPVNAFDRPTCFSCAVADRLAELGAIQTTRGDFANAGAAYERALAMWAAGPGPLDRFGPEELWRYRLAESLLRLERFDEAKVNYERSNFEPDAYWNALLFDGVRLQKAKDRGRARARFDRVLADGPQNLLMRASAQRWLASLDMQDGDHASARRRLAIALNLVDAAGDDQEPERADIRAATLLTMADLSIEDGDFVDARRTVIRAIEVQDAIWRSRHGQETALRDRGWEFFSMGAEVGERDEALAALLYRRSIAVFDTAGDGNRFDDETSGSDAAVLAALSLARLTKTELDRRDLRRRLLAMADTRALDADERAWLAEATDNPGAPT